MFHGLKFGQAFLRFFLIFFIAGFSVLGFGQTDLVRWNDASVPTPLVANMTASQMILGGGVTADNASWSGFRINNLHNGSNNTINYNKYLEFRITPNAGYKISLSQFNLRYNSPNGNAGPTKLQVRYSTNSGFPSNGTLLGTEQTLTQNSEQSISLNFPANYEVNQTLYLRVYIYGQTDLYYSDFFIRNTLYNSGTQGPTIRGVVSSASPPVAANDNATTAQNFPVNINILGNDTYSSLSAITITQQPTNGQNITVNGLTNVTYTPNSNYTGSDSFKYTITDGNGTSAPATVNITVTPVVAPTAVSDAASVIANQSKIINVLANDTQGSGAFDHITIVTNAAHGTTSINPDNTVTYTPTTNYTGTDSFQYNVTNVHNATSNTVTVSLNVLSSTALVRWNGGNGNFNPTLLVSNISSSPLTSSGGITLTNEGQNNQQFKATGWPNPSQNGGYLDQSKYVQFTITPNANYKIDLNQFNFEVQMDGGSANFEIRYSKDFSQGYSSFNGTISSGWDSKTGSLSAVSPLMPGETLYIRLYIYNTYNALRIRHSWGGTTGPIITGAVSPAITGDPADLGITLALNNNTPNVGDNVIFTIVVTNYGPNAASGATVTDQLPAGFSYVSSIASVSSYNAGTGVWLIGNLANNASATLQITATKQSLGPYTNTATISHNGADSNSSNDSSSVTPSNACANCTNLIPNGGGNIVVNSGQIYCLHAGTYTGTVTLNAGGTICIGEGATFSPSWGPSTYEGTIINHGTMNFYTYDSSTYHAHIINYATFNSTNLQNFAGILENMAGGKVEMLSGDAVFLAGSEIINHGIMTLNKFTGTNMNLTNYQQLNVNNNFYFVGSTGYFENKSGGTANLNPISGNTSITSPFDNSGVAKIYNANSGAGISTVVNNYGTMQIYQNIIFGIGTYLTNDGILEFYNAASVEFQGPLLQNNNLLTVYNNGNLALNSPISQMVNNKRVVVGGSISHNVTGSEIINNCTIISNDYFVGNGTSKNNGLIWVSNYFQLEGDTSILYNSATGFVRGTNFRNSGEIRGYGSFYFTGNTNFESNGDFIGDDPTSPIQFFDSTPTGPIFDIYTPTHPAINVIRPDSMTPYDDSTYNCSAPPTTAGYPPITREVDITQCVPATVSFDLDNDGSPVYVSPHAPVNGNAFTLLLSTIKLFDPSDENNATNNTTNLIIPGKGTFSANTTTGVVTFTPSPSFTSGTAEAQYKISNQWNGNPPVHPSPKTKITVTIAHLPELAIANGSTTICSGESMAFSNEVADGSWSSSSPSVASVNNGTVTGISSGTSTISYTITVNSFPPGNTCMLTVSKEVMVNNCGGLCYKDPNLNVSGQPTPAGISTVANHPENWPGNIPNGFLALESQNKGFVITRVSHVTETPDPINDAIIDPKEGMLIYDIQDKCIKLFNGTSWKCIQKNCNLN